MVDENEVDRDLLARVRDGDDSAYGELFSRHADAVRRFSLRHVREAAEADDLTAEAFFRMLQAIRRGSGPTDHVRTYLLTVARRVAWEWSGRRRDVPVEDEELSRRVEPVADNAARRAEHSLITRAFTSLPERWRAVLWRVEVEGERPATVAPYFGLSPNAMSALARRAREGLRAAYLQAHLADDGGRSSCASVRAKLGTFTAGGVQGVESRRIEAHLQGCAGCTSLHAELNEVCSALRAHAGLLAMPAALGAATALAAKGTLVVGTGSLALGRVKLAFAAAGVATIGLFGVMAGVFGHGQGPDVVHPDQNTVLAISTVPSESGKGTTSGDHTQQVADEQVDVAPPVQQAVVPPGGVKPVKTSSPSVKPPPPAKKDDPVSSDPPVERALPTTTTPSTIRALDTPSSAPPVTTTDDPGPTTTTTFTLYPTRRLTPT
ncbi:sigma-70 family RNA polymerase sigma factor [Lentzea tibetensis]|uniref:Sigma-70 family RNA polymerase sigma factor n=1 Tax=Lentzea tibetensis TaxID=2591470 RepID=A0A563EZI0_9PSEU|nr:sigma-70 family RNA polymerase sigma factor [Lentzea tibetensis]TWP53125.1 sigma-70 family RNA polymerase sigma factor [Lentzea tibetensis]